MAEMTISIVVKIPASDGWSAAEETHDFVFRLPDDLRIAERTVDHIANDFAASAGGALVNTMKRHLQIGDG